MVQTNTQKMALAAYDRIAQQRLSDEYSSFARSFPALIHACGLAQAVAFAQSKSRNDYLSDLAKVLSAAGQQDLATPNDLADKSRREPVSGYLRLSRNALQAASWLKRYVDATGGE